MIYDEIKNIERYRGISKNLDTAIDFLEKTDLNSLPLGKTEILGDKVFANVMEAQAKAENELSFEIHKKYMDIQVDIEGTEEILIGLNGFKETTAFTGKRFWKLHSRKERPYGYGFGKIYCMYGTRAASSQCSSR